MALTADFVLLAKGAAVEALLMDATRVFTQASLAEPNAQNIGFGLAAALGSAGLGYLVARQGVKMVRGAQLAEPGN